MWSTGWLWSRFSRCALRDNYLNIYLPIFFLGWASNIQLGIVSLCTPYWVNFRLVSQHHLNVYCPWHSISSRRRYRYH